ncbi:MAG: polyphosphate kinase 2 [Xanthomonadales bacterium]|jgi:polyphosphate kinase 2|nr:polyphosphate kinase 2 [Xanthomonadales bacterium]
MSNGELKALQVELCKLQNWLQETGERAIIIFEGRDSAGKGGTIKAIQERLSHRVFRSVALPKPSREESSQWYFQRYVEHFPSAGEVVMFDRSWYNRAGVERVMGFCTEAQVERFFVNTPNFERSIVSAGITLLKYWLEIDPEVQRERLGERQDDPRKYWKLSPMDLQAQPRWYDYSRARDDMFRYTDIPEAPWFVVPSNDQKAARLNCIAHLLSQFNYNGHDYESLDVEIPPVDESKAYDDRATLAEVAHVPQRYD